MSAFLLWLGAVLEAGTLAGLLRRRRLGRAWLLPALLVSLLVPTVLFGLRPDWHTWTAWLAVEVLHVSLTLLLGFELALRLFVAVPDARREARRWIVGVVVGLALLLVTVPAGPLATHVLPRLLLAVAGLYVGLLATAWHHALPLDPLHRRLLHGLTVYSLVSAGTWHLTDMDTRLTNLINPFVFDIFMLGLLHASWREERPELAARAEALLQPWRRRERRGRHAAGRLKVAAAQG